MSYEEDGCPSKVKGQLSEESPPKKRHYIDEPIIQVKNIVASINDHQPMPDCMDIDLETTTIQDSQENISEPAAQVDLPHPVEVVTEEPPKVVDTFPSLDHTYCLSSETDYKKRCDRLMAQVEQCQKVNQRLKKKYLRLKKKSGKCKSCEGLKSRLSSKLTVELPEGQFNDEKLVVVHELLSKKSKGLKYGEEMKSFAHGLFFYSPKAYNHVAKFLTLPHPQTIRKLLGKFDCWPGFLGPAFAELEARIKDAKIKNEGKEGRELDLTYYDAALSVDAISIKKSLQYEPRLGRAFGYVDYGGTFGIGASDILAKDALFVMVVGLRSYWKLPIAYFLVDGVTANEQTEIIKLALYKTKEVGVRIRTTVMDGTQANFATFNKLGCNMQPDDARQMITSFPHPHPDVPGLVYAMFDPSHMVKNVRNLMKHYEEIYWQGRGTVRWRYLEVVDAIQTICGFRLGNKVTSRHVNFEKLKMKVKLATQLLSDSTARTLRWGHSEQIDGLEEDDVLITADFIDLHDKLFDICNSRALYAPGYKRALTPEKLYIAEEIFIQFEEMYEKLSVIVHDGRKKVQDYEPVPILKCERRAGPLGFLSCIRTYRQLVADMEPDESKWSLDSDKLMMKFLCTCKCQQDQLECYFCALRNQSGASRNPTGSQVRYGTRSMLTHAGKHLIAMNGNCEQQEEVLLNVSNVIKSRTDFLSENEGSSLGRVHHDHPYSKWENEEVKKKSSVMHIRSSCIADHCKVCSASICYIAGFYVFTFQKLTQCLPCKNAMTQSINDPCPNQSLIKFKNYSTIEGAGLKFPSGSLCRLLFLCEKTMRRNVNRLHINKIEDFLLGEVLTQVDKHDIFTKLGRTHALETCQGIDNDYLNLIRLVSKKFFRLRIKKLCKDEALERSHGNSIDRVRIFKGL